MLLAKITQTGNMLISKAHTKCATYQPEEKKKKKNKTTELEHHIRR